MAKPSINAGFGPHADDLPQRFFTFPRSSGLPRDYFYAPEPINAFHILMGVLIGFALVTLVWFATHMH